MTEELVDHLNSPTKDKISFGLGKELLECDVEPLCGTSLIIEVELDSEDESVSFIS